MVVEVVPKKVLNLTSTCNSIKRTNFGYDVSGVYSYAVYLYLPARNVINGMIYAPFTYAPQTKYQVNLASLAPFAINTPLIYLWFDDFWPKHFTHLTKIGGG